MPTIAWIVGGSGLLGSALVRLLDLQPGTIVLRTPTNWSDSAGSVSDLKAGAERWLSTPGATRFDLYWAAGAGVTSTGNDVLNQETLVFEGFLDGLRAFVGNRAGDIGIFLASSAGGVYAGSAGAPFTELSEVVPISPYGVAKLAMERMLRDFTASAGVRSFSARISNLYGPGQRIEKPQGFISHLCRSLLSRIPMAVYVPLDTMRDYIYVDDAAVVIIQGMDLLHAEAGPPAIVIKNVCSGVPTTMGHILHEAKLVFKRTPVIIVAPSVLGVGQANDLRVVSVVWPELERIPRRPLLIGLVQTRANMEIQRSTMGIFS